MGKEAGSMTRKISILRRLGRDWRWARRDWRTLSGKKAAGIENESLRVVLTVSTVDETRAWIPSHHSSPQTFQSLADDDPIIITSSRTISRRRRSADVDLFAGCFVECSVRAGRCYFGQSVPNH